VSISSTSPIQENKETTPEAHTRNREKKDTTPNVSSREHKEIKETKEIRANSGTEFTPQQLIQIRKELATMLKSYDKTQKNDETTTITLPNTDIPVCNDIKRMTIVPNHGFASQANRPNNFSKTQTENITWQIEEHRNSVIAQFNARGPNKLRLQKKRDIAAKNKEYLDKQEPLKKEVADLLASGYKEYIPVIEKKQNEIFTIERERIATMLELDITPQEKLNLEKRQIELRDEIEAFNAKIKSMY
jgi:hypothetical protein